MNEYKLTAADNGNGIELKLGGRIDSMNAPALEKELSTVLGTGTGQTVTVDIEELEFISSAGLRVLLRLRKAGHKLKLINAVPDVYEVLEMTGFTELLNVTRALRRLDLSNCEVIGSGSNGTVYRYTDEIIVKVHKKHVSQEIISRERELSRKAFVLGINTAIPYDVVKVGDSYGTVFELLKAKGLSKHIKKDPDGLEHYIEVFCTMLKEIHATEVEEGFLPRAKDTYLKYAEFMKDVLTAERYEKLKRLISDIPDSNRMLHGDYHTGNVMYDGREAVLIDLDTLATGDPIFEFASIYLAYIGFNKLDSNCSETFLGLNSDMCIRIYNILLNDYLATGDEAELRRADECIQLLGNTRLLRRTIRRRPEEKEKIAALTRELSALIDKTDKLSLF